MNQQMLGHARHLHSGDNRDPKAIVSALDQHLISSSNWS
jgi:hypothetical protein